MKRCFCGGKFEILPVFVGIRQDFNLAGTVS